MKKIGNIRKKFLTRERIMLIIEYLTKPSKQKSWTDGQRKAWDEFMADYAGNVDRLYKELCYQTYVPGDFKVFKKKEGKKWRTIYASFPIDQIVDLLLTDCL